MSASTTETDEASAELLRMALPMMSKHAADYTPQSYAVWYDYVRGANENLKTDIDSALKAHKKLSSTHTYDLYQRHIIDRAEQMLGKARNDIAHLVNELDGKLASAGDNARSFNDQLTDFGQKISGELKPEDLRQHVDQMASSAAQLGESMVQVRSELNASQDEIKRLTDELQRARDEALVDALTQVKNRKAYELALAQFLAESRRTGKPVSCIMFDIDHFKKINDEYGHLFGDQVIRAVAQAIKGNVKGRDLVARYGGEEFIVLLPDTKATGAVIVADHIRTAIERGRIKKRNSEESVGAITISGGVAEYNDKDSPQAFIERADRGLYQAKQSGRNRVCVV